MSFGDQFFKAGEKHGRIKAIARCGFGAQFRVGFGNADDLDLGAVPRLLEKSVHVTMNQAHNADAKRRMCWRRCLRKQESCG
jgi:hypothetical protein